MLTIPGFARSVDNLVCLDKSVSGGKGRGDPRNADGLSGQSGAEYILWSNGGCAFSSVSLDFARYWARSHLVESLYDDRVLSVSPKKYYF